MTDLAFPLELDNLGVARALELGLTDGLPVHPPLRATVDTLVAGSGLPADHIISRPA